MPRWTRVPIGSDIVRSEDRGQPAVGGRDVEFSRSNDRTRRSGAAYVYLPEFGACPGVDSVEYAAGVGQIDEVGPG